MAVSQGAGQRGAHGGGTGRLRVQDLGDRWGSCGKGAWLNSTGRKAILLLARVAEYVVVHEMNHVTCTSRITRTSSAPGRPSNARRPVGQVVTGPTVACRILAPMDIVVTTQPSSQTSSQTSSQ